MAIREVIFRGKRVDNGEWVEGILFNAEEDTFIIPHGNEYSYDPMEGLAFDVYGCKVAPETVGQYTGLTDKNGKKIFEGDIIEYNEKIGKIKYSECDAAFDILFDTWNTDFSVIDERRIEVIGNIHDNPELME